MKQEEVDLKDQCKYCQRSFNTSHCVELSVRVKEEYSFHCPFFVFDKSIHDDEHKQKIQISGLIQK